jgi:stage V sporulation protein R
MGEIMMTKDEIKRMNMLEKRIKEIAEEEGLITTNIIFEVVSAHRMIEGMAYNFPTNFSHWTFGAEYDRLRTIYDHSGSGIPYEVVWNFDVPKAFLVSNNPFALNVLTVAHVYGHVDHFLRSRYFQHGRSFADIAEEARYTAGKFREYQRKYGKDDVEKLLDAGMSVQWHQHPDPFYEEQDEEKVRSYLKYVENEKIHALKTGSRGSNKDNEGKILAAQSRLKDLRYKTPPEPVYDVLKYIIDHAPRLEDWERNALTLFRKQARALAPNRRVKMLAEGWATYWHTIIMRRLCDEKLLTDKEHGVYIDFHAKVTQRSRSQFNVYCVGPAFFAYMRDRWDHGKFGREYDECENPLEKRRWNTGAMKGREKIFEIAEKYTDRMAVSEFFTDNFIHDQDLYIYKAEIDQQTGEIVYSIAEKNPEVIRRILTSSFTLYDLPVISVTDGNYNDRGELYLRHSYNGRELSPEYRNGALGHIGYAWRRPVNLETVVDEKPKLFTYDGRKHYDKQLLLFPSTDVSNIGL